MGMVQRSKQSDRFLKLSTDRKVSPRGIYQASRDRWIPTVPNSFGLPAGSSCPGKTKFCESCYAANTENQSGVLSLVQHNLDLLMEAGTVDAMSCLIFEMISRYLVDSDLRGIADEDRIFRIHWDGDFFSLDYAEAWARVIRMTPDIQYWAYTRSFADPVNVVPILDGVKNLQLYLSVDEWNIDEGIKVVAAHPNVHLAYCAIDYKTAMALMPDRRKIVCPENALKMPLMSDDGRGACVDCRLCVDGREDVVFAISHQEDVQKRKPPPARKSRLQKPLVCRSCGTSIQRKAGRGRPPLYCEQCKALRGGRRANVA